MGWAAPSDITRNNFGALRLLLALLVIYSHSYPLSGGRSVIDGLMRISNHQMDCGSLAVDGFFVISGFLLAHSWTLNPGWSRFMGRRTRRILPGYFAAMLYCAFVVAPVAFSPWQNAFSGLQMAGTFVRALLLTSYPESRRIFSTNPYPFALNGSLWTIQFEFTCYVLLAIAGALGLVRKRSVVLSTFSLLLASLGLQLFHPGQELDWPIAHGALRCADLLFAGNLWEWPRLLAFFWAGVTFHSWRNHIPRSWPLAAGACAAIVLSTMFGKLALALPIAGTYLLMWIAYHPGLRLEHFGRRGDFSYGTYLYAFPLQQLAVHWLPGIYPLALFGISAPGAIVAGAISWHAVEKRFVRHPATSIPIGVWTLSCAVPAARAA
jgi:peptidoglycan/LPS O-acetylase OafA/YrhL